MWGDAENIPMKPDSLDIVINVESSHCYGNFKAFINEVERIMKPGGQFLYTDFMTTTEVPSYEKAFESTGLKLVDKQDITQNVLLSLKFDSVRRMNWILNRTPKVLHWLLKRFSGAEGSSIFNDLKSGEVVYLAYHFTKPK